jgi:hypothetical protein
MKGKIKVYAVLMVALGLLVQKPGFINAQERIQTPEPISGRSSNDAEEVLPADVLARAHLIRAELELIRFEMGKPKNQQREIGVTGASPREVFFQALTLFRKADRLSFDQARKRGKEPKTIRAADIRPYHVWHALDRALQQVLIVKKKIGIREEVKEVLQDERTTPSQVFQSIVQGNRQLNILLDKQFSPSDVFQQVTRAVAYAERILVHFPQSLRMPQAPTFEHGKRPPDVYRRLLGCFERIRAVSEASGNKMLKLEVGTINSKIARPSDVYDVASLVVSELAYLHSQLKDADTPEDVHFPGRKFPSHVFQRVGILEAQLIELEKHAADQPDWLKG